MFQSVIQKMKQIVCFIIVLFLFIGCSNQPEKGVGGELISSQKPEVGSITNKEWSYDKLASCNFKYDTISDMEYVMHRIILDKYKNKEKRGYTFSGEGDTINEFLYHKDITEFVYSLNPKEKSHNKVFTNKIVFLILEREPKMLDYGLARCLEEKEKLEYFMEHVSRPLCNTVPIDSVINIVKREMGEQDKERKRLKEMVLMNLERSKTKIEK